MSDRSDRLIAEIESLRARRYPDLVVHNTAEEPLSHEDALAASSATGLALVDFREAVLKADDSVVPGAYTRTQLRDWIKGAALAEGGVFVVNVDEVIAPWEATDRVAFFRELLRIECRESSGSRDAIPVVLVTKHREILDLPPAGLGQGSVLSL